MHRHCSQLTAGMRPLQSSPLWGHCVKATIHARSRQAICSASAHRYISTHLPGKPSAGQALHYRPSTHKSHSRSVLCIGSLHGMTRGCGPGRAAWIPESRHRTCLPAMVGKQVDVEQPCRCACLLQLRCQAKPVRLDPSLGALTLLQAPATQPSRPTCVNQSSAAVSASASDQRERRRARRCHLRCPHPAPRHTIVPAGRDPAVRCEAGWLHGCRQQRALVLLPRAPPVA